MAIKQFTTGEVLTSSDTNTYLANSGLVYVTSVSLSGATINVPLCFTDAYTNYKIVGSNITTTLASYPGIQMLSGTTPNTTAACYVAMRGMDSNGANLDIGLAQTVAYVGRAITAGAQFNFDVDIMNPKVAVKTALTGTSVSFYDGVGAASWAGGSIIDVTTAFDGFRMTTNSGTTYTGGTVTVFGYRKA